MMKSAVLFSVPAFIGQVSAGNPPPGLGPWLLCFLYVSGTCFFLIKGINEGRALLGRKPSVDHVLEQVNVSITGLVAKPEFDKKIEEHRVRDVGLEAQISEVRHMIPTEAAARSQEDTLLREELRDSFNALRTEVDRKVGEAIAAGNSNASKTHSRIDAMAQQVGHLMGEVKHVATAVTAASQAAHEAAIAAAKAGGGRTRA